MSRSWLTFRVPRRRACLCAALALALCAPVMAQHHNTHDERALKEPVSAE